jgi:hypothetical protein
MEISQNFQQKENFELICVKSDIEVNPTSWV